MVPTHSAVFTRAVPDLSGGFFIPRMGEGQKIDLTQSRLDSKNGPFAEGNFTLAQIANGLAVATAGISTVIPSTGFYIASTPSNPWGPNLGAGYRAVSPAHSKAAFVLVCSAEWRI